MVCWEVAIVRPDAFAIVKNVNYQNESFFTCMEEDLYLRPGLIKPLFEKS